MTTTAAATIFVSCGLILLGLLMWGPRRAKRPGENRIEPAPHKAWVTACSMCVSVVGMIAGLWWVWPIFTKQS